MTREEAARILESVEVMILNGDVIAAEQAGRMAIRALRELDAQDKPFGEWISVKDRLPEVPKNWERMQVIVYSCCGVDTAWFQCDTKKFYHVVWSGTEFIGVTHWMPMPQPPKEEHHAE